jgi:hypothetical protein
MGRFTKKRIKGGESSKLKAVVDRIRRAMLAPDYNNHEANLALLKQSLTGSRRHTKDKPSTPHQTAANTLVTDLETLIKTKTSRATSNDAFVASFSQLGLSDDHNCDDFTQFFENRADGNCLFDAVAQIYEPIHIDDNRETFQQRVVPIATQLRGFISYYYKYYNRLKSQPFKLPDLITGLGTGPMTHSDYADYIGRDAIFGSDADLAIMAKLLGFSVKAIVNNDPSQNREIDLESSVSTAVDDYYTFCNNRSGTHWVLKRGGKPRDFNVDIGRARRLTHPLKPETAVVAAEATTAAHPVKDAVGITGPNNNFENIRNRITKKLYRNVKHHNQYIQNRRRTVTTKNNIHKNNKIRLAKDMNYERFYMDPNVAWNHQQKDDRAKQAKLKSNIIARWSKKSEANKHTTFRALKSPNIPKDNHVNIGQSTQQMLEGISLWNTMKIKERSQSEAQYTKQINEGLMRPEGWGPDLFDPKDGSEIIQGSYIKNKEHLERQCILFEKSQKKVPDYKLGHEYGIVNKTTMYGVMVKLFLNPLITLDEMVSFKLIKSSFVGNDMYEVLCSLFVFFGGIPGIQAQEGQTYKFIDKIEKYNNDTHTVYTTNLELFEALEFKATKKNGMADVALVHNTLLTREQREKQKNPLKEKMKKIYLMSVKYFEAGEKSQKKYDISDFYTHKLDFINNDIDLGIIVFVKERDEFTYKCLGADSHEQISKCQQIYGFEDVKTFLTNERYKLFKGADERRMTPVQYFNDIYNMGPSPREENLK